MGIAWCSVAFIGCAGPEAVSAAWAALSPVEKQARGEVRGVASAAAWAALSPVEKQARGDATSAAMSPEEKQANDETYAAMSPQARGDAISAGVSRAYAARHPHSSVAHAAAEATRA